MEKDAHITPGAPLPLETARDERRRERRHIGRLIGMLYVTGAAFGALSLLLPHPQANDTALAVLSIGAFALGLPLAIFHRRGLWMSHVVTAAAVAVISLAVGFSGDPGSVYALLFVWVVLLTAYFFPKRQMALHLAWMLVAYGVALLAIEGHEHHFSPVTRWLLTALALSVTGGMTSWLVAKRRDAERAYRHLAAIVDSSQDAVISVKLDGTITSWNEGAERLYGYPAAEALGRSSAILSPADRPTEIAGVIARIAAGERVEPYGATRRRSDGTLIDVSLTVSAVCDDGGQVVGASAVARDITARRKLEMDRARLLSQIRALARTDPLTGLANRRAWDDDLDRELARAERREATLVVALLDLDRFKRFNDEHGHVAGDELLKLAAENWRSELRPTDFIARYGGEEFVVLLSDLTTEQALEALERLRASIPMGQTCSAGLAEWDGSESATMLTARADAALYEAKRAGRDRVVTARGAATPSAVAG